MIRVQARGVETTGGDYSFLGAPPPRRWWNTHAAAEFIRWEELAVLVDADGGGWRAAVFGIQAHLDRTGRRTQIMLAFDGVPGEDDEDARLLLQLLQSLLADGGAAAAAALVGRFPVEEVLRLRALSESESDAADIASAETDARDRARLALATLPAVEVTTWTRAEDVAVAAHQATGADEFLSVVAALCSGSTGRAMISASVQNEDAAAEVAAELLRHPGVSYVLVTEARSFQRIEQRRPSSTKEVAAPKKAAPGEPGSNASASGLSRSGDGRSSGGDEDHGGYPAVFRAPHLVEFGTLTLSPGEGVVWPGPREYPVLLNHAMSRKIQLLYQRDQQDLWLSLELLAGGEQGLIQISLTRKLMGEAEVEVTREGGWLTCVGLLRKKQDGISRIELKVRGHFDWSGMAEAMGSGAAIMQVFSAIGSDVSNTVSQLQRVLRPDED